MSTILPDGYRCVNITDTFTVRRDADPDFNPEPTTICREFREAAKKWGDYNAIIDKDQKATTYSQYYANAMKVAKSFVHLGFNKKDTVGIIGFNSPEYFFTCHGAWLADAVPAGIYTTNAPDACFYVLNHCEAKVCVCQGGKQAAKIVGLRSQLPNMKAIVVYWPEDGFPEVDDTDGFAKVYKWEDFLELGSAVSDDEINARIDGCEPGSCATLIYTSGTTGDPKGVMCSHDACMANALSVRVMFGLDDNDRIVSFLPLNHIAAQYVDLMVPMRSRVTMYIARPDALKGTLTTTLQFARPTLYVAVPRVYEKMMEAINANLHKKSAIAQFLISRARKCAYDTCMTRQYKKQFHSSFMYPIYNKLVLNTIRSLLGFDKCRGLVVSAAPVTEEVLNFFASFDMPIYDLLGQSEGTAPISMNTYIGQKWKLGSCGYHMPGVAMKIGENEELLFTGRNIMMGYLKAPEQTLRALDADGWVHTGDMAREDEDGFFYIKGRLKELIVTAGGENIPPIYIENSIIELCPSISNIIVIGDKRKFLSCLITLKCQSDAQGEPTNELGTIPLKQSQALGSSATTTQEVIDDPKWKEYIDSVIDRYNKEKAISNAQQIRKWTLLEKDMSLAAGELTATMKLKRSVINQRYEQAINKMYE